ncbi:hypothetical protein [Pantoea cypripedii]|uniref:hypothetical protein n=1 Tax=Pantoea cypripedii TaxID=55209 RepID=UPI001ABF802D|nr:hypothetical protein [Pantoea cypripedii]
MTQVTHGLTRDELVKRVYGEKSKIDWGKTTQKEIETAAREVVRKWRSPASNQQRGG